MLTKQSTSAAFINIINNTVILLFIKMSATNANRLSNCQNVLYVFNLLMSERTRNGDKEVALSTMNLLA